MKANAGQNVFWFVLPSTLVFAMVVFEKRSLSRLLAAEQHQHLAALYTSAAASSSAAQLPAAGSNPSPASAAAAHSDSPRLRLGQGMPKLITEEFRAAAAKTREQMLVTGAGAGGVPRSRAGSGLPPASAGGNGSPHLRAAGTNQPLRFAAPNVGGSAERKSAAGEDAFAYQVCRFVVLCCVELLQRRSFNNFVFFCCAV